MHDLGAELWRAAKELRGSPAGEVLTLLASVLIVAAAAWRVTLLAGRGVRACWRRCQASGVRGQEEDYPEGA